MIFINCPYISFYIYYIFNLLLNESAHLQKIKEEKTSSHSNYVIKEFRFVTHVSYRLCWQCLGAGPAAMDNILKGPCRALAY